MGLDGEQRSVALESEGLRLLPAPSPVLPLWATHSQSLLMDNRGVKFKARSMGTHFFIIPVVVTRSDS